MNGEERKDKIISLLEDTPKAVSGTALAQKLGVSRQVIVQDMALLRANGYDITSTNRGYLLNKTKLNTDVSRVLKVVHTDEEVEEELTLIVDLGGKIQDVFVFHKIYGVLRAPMNIRSRLDVHRYMQEIAGGKSSFLKNVTSNYHYHTIAADSEQILDEIQNALRRRGFLAPLQDYEPVKFGV